MAHGAAKAAQDRSIRRAALAAERFIPDLEYHYRHLERIASSSDIHIHYVSDETLNAALDGVRGMIDGIKKQVADAPPEPAIKETGGFRT